MRGPRHELRHVHVGGSERTDTQPRTRTSTWRPSESQQHIARGSPSDDKRSDRSSLFDAARGSGKGEATRPTPPPGAHDTGPVWWCPVVVVGVSREYPVQGVIDRSEPCTTVERCQARALERRLSSDVVRKHSATRTERGHQTGTEQLHQRMRDGSVASPPARGAKGLQYR